VFLNIFGSSNNSIKPLYSTSMPHIERITLVGSQQKAFAYYSRSHFTCDGLVLICLCKCLDDCNTHNFRTIQLNNKPKFKLSFNSPHWIRHSPQSRIDRPKIKFPNTLAPPITNPGWPNWGITLSYSTLKNPTLTSNQSARHFQTRRTWK